MRPIAKALAAGAVAVVVYLTVVVATTPALPPEAAVSAALGMNAIIIVGMGAAIGLQVFVSARSKALGCRIGIRRGIGGSSGGAATTSFLSFFSLVPLGCCGWWLYVLSLLPGVLGVGASAVLIEHSQLLAYLGLTAVLSISSLGAYRLLREETRRVERLT